MKIVKMIDLAKSYKLQSIKKFDTVEKYLEYTINEINSKGTKYTFYQFLVLSEILYVLLNEKKSEKFAPGRMVGPVVEKFRPLEEINAHYDMEDVADYALKESNKKSTKSRKVTTKKEKVVSTEPKLFETKLDW